MFIFKSILSFLFIIQISFVEGAAEEPTKNWDGVIQTIKTRITHCQAQLPFFSQPRDAIEPCLPDALRKRLRQQDKQLAQATWKKGKIPDFPIPFEVCKRTCETLCNGNIERYENMLHICGLIKETREKKSPIEEENYVHLLRFLMKNSLRIFNNGKRFYDQLWEGFGVHEKESILSIRSLVNELYPITQKNRETAASLEELVSLITEQEDIFGHQQCSVKVRAFSEATKLYNEIQSIVFNKEPYIETLQEKIIASGDYEKLFNAFTKSMLLLQELGSEGASVWHDQDHFEVTALVRKNVSLEDKLDNLAKTIRTWHRKNSSQLASFILSFAQEIGFKEDEPKSLKHIKKMSEDELILHFNRLTEVYKNLDDRKDLETYLSHFAHKKSISEFRKFNPLTYYRELFNSDERKLLSSINACVLSTLHLLPLLEEMRKVVAPAAREFETITIRHKQKEENEKRNVMLQKRGFKKNRHTCIADTPMEQAVSPTLAEERIMKVIDASPTLSSQEQTAVASTVNAICAAARIKAKDEQQPKEKTWESTKLYRVMSAIQNGESVKKTGFMSALESFVRSTDDSRLTGQGGSRVKVKSGGSKLDFHSKHKKGGANQTDNLITNADSMYKKVKEWLQERSLSLAVLSRP